ncbi:Ribosome biogenesis ATPase rix7 [Zalaria obscura]|uniref:Ribosome biogenesis ATPase rix7 n=1 Tax=Zalaria obscura TaxID=2024903 RepID=A0ACC3S4W8_9PEZI
MGRPSLRQGLDKEVYQVVLPLLESHPPDVRSLYQAIQRSNSSLKRKPKRLVEDALERVLEVLAEEDGEDEEAAVEQKEQRAVEEPNLMNRAITGSWNLSNPSTAPGTPLQVNGASSEGLKERERDGQPPKKRRKPEKEVDRSPPTDISLEDLGGVDDVIMKLKELLVLPLIRPERFAKLGLPLPRGILLHGPPGCGKSMLTKAYAAKLGVPFVEIMGPSIVSGMSGESEKQVRDLFDEARKLAPCLIFIDEIDVIAPKRESSQSQMEKRIVAQLLLSIDSLAMENKKNEGKPVIVLAATNRPDSLDPALRRGGRFDTEINMGVPNEPMRESILRTQTRKTPMADDVDFAKLAKMTAGFVGADLRDLVGKAGAWEMQQYSRALEKQAEELDTSMEVDEQKQSKVMRSLDLLIKRARDNTIAEPEGFEDEKISMQAFTSVLPGITPSSKREGFATVPDTSWDDIGALKAVREELETAIVGPIQNPELYAQVGISVPTGVLLWGPPGCGKTLLAKAVAAESKANFISVKGPELLNKYVGESERAVRTLFTRARSSAPCVIFFDELDALVPRRDDSVSEASARVVNTLLTELDGLSARTGIYVIAATNRPDIIDEAMMRPGRLETPLFVDLPGPEERVEILRALIRGRGGNWPPGIEEIAREKGCDGYSGADLESLLRKAGQQCLKRKDFNVSRQDFELAIGQIRGSVGSMEKYYKLKERFSRGF